MENILLISLFLFLFGCIPYQERQNGGFGHNEMKLTKGFYALAYYASYDWSISDAKKHWETRATELCGAPEYKKLRYEEDTESLGMRMAYNSGIVYGDNVMAAVSTGFVQCPSFTGTSKEASDLAWDSFICWSCDDMSGSNTSNK